MPPKPKGLSVRDYARHRKGLGLHPWSKSAIQRALALGYIHRLPSGGLDPEIADEEWHLAVNPAKRHQHELRESGPEEGPLPPGLEPPEKPAHLSYADVRAIREWYDCQIKRLEYLKLTGEVVTAESVRASTFDVLRGIRNRFQQIPSRLDALLAAETDPRAVNAAIRAEIDGALQDLAKKFESKDEDEEVEK